MNPDMANIEIIQDDDSDGDKKSKKKKKKKDRKKDKKKKKNNKDNIDEVSVKKSYTAKDLALSKMNSKVQFSEGVSNKEMDMDFYHNRGKDSNLDLRSLERLEKIDFSEESEEEVVKKPKKKKKKSKKKC